MEQTTGVISRIKGSWRAIFLLKILAVCWFYYVVVTPAHELGHYLVATAFGVGVTNVKWFAWPWEIFSGPHIEFAEAVSGFSGAVIRLSGLGLSLVIVAITIIVLDRLWGARDWGLLLVPLSLASAFSDLGGGPLGWFYFILVFLMFLYLMNVVALKARRNVSDASNT